MRVARSCFRRPGVLLLGSAWCTRRSSPSSSRSAERRQGHLSASTTTRGCSPSPTCSLVLRNTVIWVVLVPLLATGVRPGLRDPGRPGPRRGVRQGADLPADGDLVRRRQHHLEVRLPVPRRPAQPQIGLLNADPRSGSASRPQQFLINAPLEHLLPDHRDDLDPGRIRDDRAVRRDQGDPRRHHRGRPARRRHRAGRCSGASPCRASARARRRDHHDRHRHAEGLRHRPDHDRRQLRHRSSPTSSTTRLPVRRRAGSARRSPCCCSSSSSRSSSTTSARCGRRRDPMSTVEPVDVAGEDSTRTEHTADAPVRRSGARPPPARVARSPRRGRPWPRSSSRCCGPSRRSACSSPRSAEQRTSTTSGWWTSFSDPSAHAGELPAGAGPGHLGRA